MIGMPLGILRLRTAFARNCGMPSMLLPRIQTLGLAMKAALGDTSSHDFPSAWCTCAVVTMLRSSPWLTVGAGRAIGGRDSDMPSNLRMQRTALRAAADPVRSADKSQNSRLDLV